MDNEFEAVILGACRTPIGAFGGALKEVSAVDLGAIVIREAIARAGVPPADLGDAVAAESQARAVRAIAEGRFTDEIVAVPVPQRKGDPVMVDTDEYPRAGTTVEKLGALKPAFKRDGSVTAGNASGVNDGAAALV